jgi:hypothetical protein
MPLKKVKKALEKSLITEQGKCPSTMLGGLFHKFKIRSIERRIKEIETELTNRKTKK